VWLGDLFSGWLGRMSYSPGSFKVSSGLQESSDFVTGDSLSPETSKKLRRRDEGLAGFLKPTNLFPTSLNPPKLSSWKDESIEVSDAANVDIMMEIDELVGAFEKDPCVLSFGTSIVLRSFRGRCISMSRCRSQGQEVLNLSVMDRNELPLPAISQTAFVPKNRSSSIETDLSATSIHPRQTVGEFTMKVDGNPTNAVCEFQVVECKGQKKKAVVRNGDMIALRSLSRERFIALVPGDSVAEDKVGTLEKKIKACYWFVRVLESNSRDRRGEMGRKQAQSEDEGISFVSQNEKSFWLNSTVRFSEKIWLESAEKPGFFLCLVDNDGASEESLDLTQRKNSSAAMWDVVKCPCPYVPLWSRSREHLYMDENDEPNMVTEEDIQTFKKTVAASNDVLQDELVEAALHGMQGIDGRIIEKDPERNTWGVRSDLIPDRALLRMLERMLPLCGAYTKACTFIEKRSRYEHGRVAHAMAAAMRSLLREFDVLVAQLEHQHRMGQLSLQRLWYYVQPSLQTLLVLGNVADETKNDTGGVLLNAVHRLALRGGDSRARSIYQYLLQHATAPYLEMLEEWIFHGVIKDDYDEFLVREDALSNTKGALSEDFLAGYWSRRYTLRIREERPLMDFSDSGEFLDEEDGNAEEKKYEQVPFFLKQTCEKVLNTGKYLNVVRQCGRWVDNPEMKRIPYSDQSHAFDRIIHLAHDFASQTLLRLLLDEEKLVPRLRALKHYFLLDQGDFFVHFMDIAQDELLKPREQILLTRLQSLLEMSLRMRNIDDPYQEDLTCDLLPYGLMTHVELVQKQFRDPRARKEEEMLSGIEAFAMDFKVRWPLSLVLSREVLIKYQLIFRHLFFCKHVERHLCATWQAHQTTKELNVRSSLGAMYSLRQRMLHFLQNLEYYFMFEVLEPNWQAMEKKVAKAKTVDELMDQHKRFLDNCLANCLLTRSDLLNTLSKIMMTCLSFAERNRKLAEDLEVDVAAIARQCAESERRVAVGERKPKRAPSNRDLKDMQLEAAAAEQSKSKKLRQAVIDARERNLRLIVDQDSYRSLIREQQESFESNLRTFMEQLSRTAELAQVNSQIATLCSRLDFNSFYNKTTGL